MPPLRQPAVMQPYRTITYILRRRNATCASASCDAAIQNNHIQAEEMQMSPVCQPGVMQPYRTITYKLRRCNATFASASCDAAIQNNHIHPEETQCHLCISQL